MSIGFDVGTFSLICAKRNKKEIEFNKGLNSFIEIPLENRFLFNMMKNSGVPLIERDNIGYVLGEAAVNMAYTLASLELKRPMSNGCVNPKEKSAFEILQIMIHSLIGEISRDNEKLYYCVPANAVNTETDAEYHQKIIHSIFKSYESEQGYKLDPHPINEALAVVYAEMEKKAYTGIGISCLCPGTKIYTKKGIKNIEDVEIGDLVLTHKGRWKPVLNVITKDYEGLQTKLQISGYTNTTNDYKFVDNHEIYVLRNNQWTWVGCEELKEHDIVGEPIEEPDVPSKALAMTICEKTTNSKKTAKKRIEISGDVWRLIGYFLADGSINKKEKCINFDFKNSEKENIKDVQDILAKNFNKYSALTTHGDNCTRVKCYSKGMSNYFKRFYSKSKEKIFPWDLSRLTKGDCINLLAGLIRGDGCIRNSDISFENTSSCLAILTKQLFSKIGIPAYISYRNPRSHTTNNKTINGKKQSWSVGSGSKTTLNSICQIISEINCDNSIHAEKIFIHKGMCCGKIQKIEHEEYKGIVYDLQVEEDHSFSGPQLTIHNCGGGMVNVCYAMYGNPIFQFAIVNSGDWIDKQAAKATGESVTVINREKMKIDLSKEPTNMIERAVNTQYRIMIEKTIQGIKEGLSNAKNNVRSAGAVDVVVAGGTSSIAGFDILFKEAMKNANLSIEIADVVRAENPTYTIAKGCLIAAENSN